MIRGLLARFATVVGPAGFFPMMFAGCATSLRQVRTPSWRASDAYVETTVGDKPGECISRGLAIAAAHHLARQHRPVCPSGEMAYYPDGDPAYVLRFTGKQVTIRKVRSEAVGKRRVPCFAASLKIYYRCLTLDELFENPANWTTVATMDELDVPSPSGAIDPSETVPDEELLQP